MSANASIGVIGLAVMGANLALNIESRGFRVAVYNRTGAVTDEFMAGEASTKNFAPAKTLADFVASLERPRRILIMVKAGKPVDAVIDELKPLLDKGDILIDGGNTHYPDTERRYVDCNNAGFRFVGMGVSGGEEGARFGPSLMPGGDEASFRDLQPILESIAAKTDSGPCVTYIGRGAAGHFVKMVHNGIEYGDMQLIAEAYDILRTLCGLDGPAMKELFESWNEGDLESFLIEITANIVDQRDPLTKRPMLDIILDKAGQKGTGKWTTVAALDLGVPVPTITAAVDARIVSAMKDERVAASKVLIGSAPMTLSIGSKRDFIDDVRQALYAAKIMSYAQGMAMLRAASTEFNYGLNLGEIARIWKGGCIIRAALLDKIRAAFAADPALTNLLLDAAFAKAVNRTEASLRRIVGAAIQNTVAVPAMSASLAYYDSYRRERLPAYLIQAQRDYFGAHTYERVDRPGAFHHKWF